VRPSGEQVTPAESEHAKLKRLRTRTVRQEIDLKILRKAAAVTGRFYASMGDRLCLARRAPGPESTIHATFTVP